MPNGKPAGVRCVQLTRDDRCQLFGKPERPSVCLGFRPAADTCGGSRAEALSILLRLEAMTDRI